MTTTPILSGPELRKLVSEALEDSDIDLTHSKLSEPELLRYLAGLSDDREIREIEDKLGSAPELTASIEEARETCAVLVADKNLSALEKSIRESVGRAARSPESVPRGIPALKKISDGLRSLFDSEFEALPAIFMSPAMTTGHAHAGEPVEKLGDDRNASVQAQFTDGNLMFTVISLVCDEGGHPIDEGHRLRFSCNQSSWIADGELRRPFPDADFVQGSVRVAAGSDDFPDGAQLIVQLIPDA